MPRLLPNVVPYSYPPRLLCTSAKRRSSASTRHQRFTVRGASQDSRRRKGTT